MNSLLSPQELAKRTLKRAGYIVDSNVQLEAIARMSLAEFCPQYLKIQDKSGAIVPLVLNRVQAHFAEHMTGRDLILKSRQIGFTTVIRAYCYKRSIEQSLRSISLAHDDKTTQKMRRMEKIYYEYMPPVLGITRTQDNAAITSYSNMSEVTLATAGSKEGGRGGTYNLFHGSEIAFWPNAAFIISGAMQGVPKDGVVIFESTPNGAQGLFYEEVQKAKAGDSEYTLHFYPWWWDDEYTIPLRDGESLTCTLAEQALVDKHGLTPEQIKWRRKKIAEPGMSDLFAQEYPEDAETCFLTSGDSAFPNIHLAMGPAVQDKPIPGHVYVGGLDWGQDNDYTALSIYDRTERREVYLNRWRREPYRSIRAHVIDACRFWHVIELSPERNSMSTNVEDLIDDIESARLPITVSPLVMSNSVKHELVTQFKNGYQDEGMKLLDIDYAKQEMNIFVKKQTPTMLWTYAAESDGHDDTVIARLIGWSALLGGQMVNIISAPGILTDWRG